MLHVRQTDSGKRRGRQPDGVEVGISRQLVLLSRIIRLALGMAKILTEWGQTKCHRCGGGLHELELLTQHRKGKLANRLALVVPPGARIVGVRKFPAKGLMLLDRSQWEVLQLQHICGVWSFACSFRWCLSQS